MLFLSIPGAATKGACTPPQISGECPPPNNQSRSSRAARRPLTILSLATAVLFPLSGLASNNIAAQEEVQSKSSPTASFSDLEGLSDQDVLDLMKKLHVPGIGVAVVVGSKIVWAKGYGVADAETQRPVKVTTRFQAASISKPITALAAVRLAEGHHFSLDENVNNLLKSWQVPKSPLTEGNPVTLRSLLSHTSGADDGFGFPGYDPYAPLPSVTQILDGKPPSTVGPVLFARPPYEAHKYSGGGLTIVQLALTDHLSRPFGKTLNETVLSPLGMTHSSFDQPPRISSSLDDLAYAHDSEGKRMGPPWHVYPELAAAGLWTTASDLAQVIIELQRAIRGPKGKILTQMSAHELIAPTGVGPFGLGFRMLAPSNDGGWYFWHGGSNWGFECRLFGHVRKGYGLVIMTNAQDSGSALLNELENRIFSAYGWDRRGKPN